MIKRIISNNSRSAIAIFFSLFTMFVLGSSKASASSHPRAELSTAEQAFIDGDLDTASEMIKQALKDTPNNANVHKLAGAVFSSQAQRASLFSAPGLAKKGLKSHKMAVKLTPDDPNARLNLMQYYLNAPSIVGGDKDLGAEQAKEIRALDPIKGVIADSIIHRTNEDKAAHRALFEQLSDELAQEPQVKLAYTSYLANNEQQDEAVSILKELANLSPDQLITDDDKLVPYKAMGSLGFTGLNNESYLALGIENFERYLSTAPRTYRLMPKPWIRYLLGKSYAQSGETQRGKKLLEEVRGQTKDTALKKEIKSALKELRLGLAKSTN